MHIFIVWFAKLEKIEIIRSNRRLGSFLLDEASSRSKRGSFIWKMIEEFNRVYNAHHSSIFFPYSGHNTERIWQIIFWYDIDESSLPAIYKVDIAHWTKVQLLQYVLLKEECCQEWHYVWFICVSFSS